MDQSPARAFTEQVERRLRRGIFAADNNYVLVPIFKWFGVVMRDVRQVLPRHSQFVWQVVITCGDRDLFAGVLLLSSLLCLRGHHEVSIAAVYPLHTLEKPHFQRDI